MVAKACLMLLMAKSSHHGAATPCPAMRPNGIARVVSIPAARGERDGRRVQGLSVVALPDGLVIRADGGHDAWGEPRQNHRLARRVRIGDAGRDRTLRRLNLRRDAGDPGGAG